MDRRLSRFVGFLGLLSLGLALGGRAQTVMTSITTSAGSATPTGGVTTDETNFTFQNSAISVTTFTAGTETYAVTGTADYAYVRRNAVNANRSSVWYNRTGTDTFAASHAEDYGSLLLGNNLNRGSDNTFANGTAEQTGNIERLDFVYSAGTVSNTSMGFAVFDRGESSVHDGFKIALITGWDYGTNTATSYSQLVSQAANWTPAGNVSSTANYTLFRYTAGDDLSSASNATETGSQGIGGVVFNLSDFNVAAGTTIYGYSLFGFDVTDGGNSSNLIDWNNAAYFPTNTNGDTGGGGIDLAAVNGVMFSAVPEPSTWALAGLGMIGLAMGVRRRRFRRAPV